MWILTCLYFLSRNECDDLCTNDCIGLHLGHSWHNKCNQCRPIGHFCFGSSWLYTDYAKRYSEFYTDRGSMPANNLKPPSHIHWYNSLTRLGCAGWDQQIIHSSCVCRSGILRSHLFLGSPSPCFHLSPLNQWHGENFHLHSNHLFASRHLPHHCHPDRPSEPLHCLHFDSESLRLSTLLTPTHITDSNAHQH